MNRLIRTQPSEKNQKKWLARLLPLIGLFLLALAIALQNFPVTAQVAVPFSVRYTTNTNGDIRFVSNTIMTCPLLDLAMSRSDVNSGSIAAGDLVDYTIQVTNRSSALTSNVILNNLIPARTTYISGSLNITAGANNGVKTDATGDDQAEFSGGQVVFRLGSGASAAFGGSISAGASTTISYRVRVNAGTSTGTQILNRVTVSYEEGGITFSPVVSNQITVGNSTTTSSKTSSLNCNTARNDTANQNNDFNMTYVDVDNDPATFNSSRADLTLPSGSNVLFAGLYWGGDSSASNSNRVLFATPTSGGYVSVSSSAFYSTTYGTNQTLYQGFANVTSLVQANGTYTVANVQSTTASNTTTSDNHWGGWSLVVVYGNSIEKPRNLTVFDGLARINTSNTLVNLSISGFITPPAGQVNAKLGVIAYEGDAPQTGDRFQLTAPPASARDITNTTNPANNVFNSSITDMGVPVATKFPNYANQLGYDADILSANGILPNGATTSYTATISLTTGGETYGPGVVTSAIDLYVPVFTINKTFTDLNGAPLEIGDTLEFAVTVTNNRDSNNNGDPANNNLLIDPIPANTTYVPGSLVINNVAQTDAAGDDRAEFDSTNNRTVFRLGTGANATQGGTIAVAPAAGSSSTIKFRVTINLNTPSGTIITNQAQHSYTGQTLGQGVSLAAASPTVSIETRTPSVSLVKRITAINDVPLMGFEGDPADPDGDGNTAEDTNWPQPATTYLRGKLDGGIVAKNDEVEYTIYFLGNRRPSTNVTICDPVPENQTFVATGYNNVSPRPLEPGALSGDTGIALAWSSTALPSAPTVYLTNENDSDRGRFFVANAAQTPAACTSNNNGAVVVNIVQGATQLPAANTPGNPPNSYGFIRFKAKVN